MECDRKHCVSYGKKTYVFVFPCLHVCVAGQQQETGKVDLGWVHPCSDEGQTALCFRNKSVLVMKCVTL